MLVFRWQERPKEGQTLTLCGRVRQQLGVDTFTCMQEVRLDYVRKYQKKLRKDLYCGLADAMSRADTTPALLEQRIAIPSSSLGAQDSR